MVIDTNDGRGMVLVFDIAVFGAVMGLMWLVVSRRVVEHAIFKNTTGIDALLIAKAESDSSSFDHFVEEISRRV